MDDHNCPRTRCDMLFQLNWVEIASHWININKDWPCTKVHNNFSSCRERIDWHNYLIIRLQTYGIESKVHRSSSRVDCQGIRRTNISGKLAFKAFCLRSSG